MSQKSRWYLNRLNILWVGILIVWYICKQLQWTILKIHLSYFKLNSYAFTTSFFLRIICQLTRAERIFWLNSCLMLNTGIFVLKFQSTMHRCYLQRNSLVDSELSPLFACKILRLGNYQLLSYKQKAAQNNKSLLWIRCL